MRFALPPSPPYRIDAPETIAVVLRATALTSNQRTVAQPAFSVHPRQGVGMISGSLLEADEHAIRSAGADLTVHLQGAAWRRELTDEDKASVLAHLMSEQLEPHGWSTVVRAALQNAATISGLLLPTDTITTPLRDAHGSQIRGSAP